MLLLWVMLSPSLFIPWAHGQVRCLMVSFCCSLLVLSPAPVRTTHGHGPSGVPLPWHGLPWAAVHWGCPHFDIGHLYVPKCVLPCGSSMHLPKSISPCVPCPLWLLLFLKCIWAETPHSPSTVKFWQAMGCSHQFQSWLDIAVTCSGQLMTFSHATSSYPNAASYAQYNRY